MLCIVRFIAIELVSGAVFKEKKKTELVNGALYILLLVSFLLYCHSGTVAKLSRKRVIICTIKKKDTGNGKV